MYLLNVSTLGQLACYLAVAYYYTMVLKSTDKCTYHYRYKSFVLSHKYSPPHFHQSKLGYLSHCMELRKLDMELDVLVKYHSPPLTRVNKYIVKDALGSEFISITIYKY